MRRPERDLHRPGEGGDVDQRVGADLVHGVGQRVGHHQAPLGVGVGDLGGAAAVVPDHVAGAHRGAADGVLGRGDQAGDPDRARSSAASAAMVAMTTAPPVMSRFMFTIASPGLMDSPPVSKVMPLPTSTTWPRALPRAAGRVVEPDQPGRRRRGRPDGEDAAEAVGRSCFSSQTLTVSPASSAASRARSASQAGFLTLEGTVAR